MTEQELIRTIELLAEVAAAEQLLRDHFASTIGADHPTALRTDLRRQDRVFDMSAFAEQVRNASA